jgi:hypothetical protein
MGKTSVGLLGAVAGLATMGAAQATTPPAINPAGALHAASYAELLRPVHNASELVKADSAARAQERMNPRDVQTVEYYYRGAPPVAHHHHHHHHAAVRHHHHHHHHHHQVRIGVPGVGVVVGSH